MTESLGAEPEKESESQQTISLVSQGKDAYVDDVIAISLGEQAIGYIELGLDKSDKQATIWDFELEEDKRGLGYGKASRALLTSYIIETYPWVKSIYSSVSSIPATKSAISTPIPNGWHRKFRILEPQQYIKDDFQVVGVTTNPNEALNWIETHKQEIDDGEYYGLGVEYLKPQEP